MTAKPNRIESWDSLPGPYPAPAPSGSGPLPYSHRILQALSCPACGHTPLEATPDGVLCSRCPEHYGLSPWGSLDLRLKQARKYPVTFEVGEPLPPLGNVNFDLLGQHPRPEVDFSSLPVPSHLSREMMSHFPRAKEPGALMLDLGCGNAVHRSTYEHAGFTYVGLDYEAEKAPLLGDAHSIPFRDESFEFVLAMALLEHIRSPAVMMREVCRVLKPGGVLMGTVAFMEPFHGDSFFHHSVWGITNTLHTGGLRPTHISPVAEWPVLYSLAEMTLFPRLPKPLSKALVRPLHCAHVLWWKLCTRFSDVPESRRLRNTAGAFIYRAVREPVARPLDWKHTSLSVVQGTAKPTSPGSSRPFLTEW